MIVPTLPPAFLFLLAIFFCSHVSAYNWSITDQSPLITYTPSSPTSNTTGWNNTYSLTPYVTQYDSPSYDSLIGLGISSHISINPGATAQLGWVGTGLSILGHADVNAFITYVDGISIGVNNGTEGILVEVNGLDNQWHDVMLQVRGLGYLELRGFGFTTDLGSDQAELSTSSRQVTDAIYNENPDVRVTGAWYSQYNTLQANDSTTGTLINYTALSNNPSISSTLIITPPLNTSQILLYGIIAPGLNSFVTEMNTSTGNAPTSMTYNLNSSWYSQQLLWQAALTPGVASIIAITPNMSTGQSLSIGSISFIQDANYTPLGGDDGSGIGKGVLAGIIIGCIALVAILGLLLLWYLRKRRSRSDPTNHPKIDKIRRPSLASEVQPYELTNIASDPNLPIEPSAVDTKPTSNHPSAPSHYSTLPHISTPSSSSSTAPVSPISATEQMGTGLVSLQEKIDSFARFAPGLVPREREREGEEGMREVDAGPAVVEDNGTVRRMAPPGYDPSWAERRE